MQPLAWAFALSFTLCALANALLYGLRLKILRRNPLNAPEPLGLVAATHAFTLECWCTLAALVSPLFAWLRWTTPAVPRGTVVLVPGCGVGRSALWLLARRLTRDGWRVRWVARTRACDIATRADGVSGALGDCASEAPLMVLGFGVGGIAARYALTHLPDSRVQRLITLGATHRGTELARHGLLTELAPGSELLLALNSGDTLPRRCDVIAIHSTFDATILPPRNAVYPSTFNVQLADKGHYTLLLSRKVAQLVRENLAAPLADS